MLYVFNRHFISITAITILSFFLSPFNIGLGNAYTILSPVSTQKIKIQARRPQSTLIIKLEDKEELARLEVIPVKRNAEEALVIAPSGVFTNNDVSYIHFFLPLKKGNNNFVINPGNEKLNILYQPVRTLLKVDFEDPKAFLFHRTAVIPKECDLCHGEQLPDDAGLDVGRLQKNADYSPECFSCHRQLHSENEWSHGPSANIYCMSCHRKGSENTKITILTGRVDEVCFQCHTNKVKVMDQRHVHGPVGTGDCTICHDPHGDAYKYQLWADGKIDLCVGCHGDKQKASKKAIGFHPHGILFGGGCVACHDPHSSDNRFQLYKPINDLCVSCHLSLNGVEKGHPVGNHPIKNRLDPLRKGRDLSCTSCHNPHGTSFRYLLIGDILGGHVCNKCHKN